MSDIKKLDFSHKADTPANKITPREVLQMALNDVDQYEYAVVILGRPNEDGSVVTRVNISAPHTYVSVGMLTHAQQIAIE